MILSSPHLIVIRSFDVNKPGAEADELQGGVAGGCIMRGVLRMGDEVEVRPGLISKNSKGRRKARLSSPVSFPCTRRRTI